MDKKGRENLDRILKGQEPKKNIQLGYTGEKDKGPDTIGKEPGDIWEENGKKWRMKENGNVENVTRFDDFRIPMFCPKCKKVMKGKKDTKSWYSNGTCLNCLVDYHHELKRQNKFKQFAFHKRLSSALDYYEEMKNNFNEFKEKITQNPEFIFSDGRRERWTNQLDSDTLIEEYENFLEDYKKKLDKGLENYEKEFGEKLEEYERPRI